MIHDEVRAAFEARDPTAIRRLFEADPRLRGMIDAPVFPFDAPALVHFAGAGDLAMVDLLLELGADPDARSRWWAGGFHALHTARGDVAERLLAAGATPDACAAANLDRIDVLRRLLDEDPSRVHERGGDGQTPLHFARSREAVDLLLERGADPDARDVDHGGTPAEWMLDQRRDAGRYALAAYLVERGGSADVFLAAALGLTDRLRTLLDRDPSLARRRTSRDAHGGDPRAADHIHTWTIGRNLSPLQVAAQFEQPEAFELLRSLATPRERFVAACLGAREDEARRILAGDPGLVEALSPDEARALPDAGWAGDAAAVDLMLRLGFDATTPGQDTGTVLHCAAWQGAADCVEAALRHAAARSIVDLRESTHGGTPLGWCCHGSSRRANPRGDYPRVARVLLEAGGSPGANLQDAAPEVLAVIRAFEDAGRG